nr:gaba transporter 1 [Quercus suber]
MKEEYNERCIVAMGSLKNGADPNASNENGETSLHYAACTVAGIKRILRLLISKAHGKKDSVRILLENHANPNVIFHNRLPPLVMASIECVELLLQAGADPNISKHGGEIIKCLLNAGADPNVTSFIYCRPTYAYFGEKMLSSKVTGRFSLRKYLVRLIFTSIYMALIAAAVPFFGDFVSFSGAIRFTPLDFVFPSVAYLKAGRMPKDAKCHLSMQLLNFAIATWFSVVAVLGCVGAVKFIIEDIKTYKFFHDM